MTYRLAYERLKAYEPQRLCIDRYHNYEGERCALGAIVPATTRYASRSIRRICEGGPWGPPNESVVGELDALGMSVGEAVGAARDQRLARLREPRGALCERPGLP